jgi:HAD superfamily hydrolase (TIGR01484 family)
VQALNLWPLEARRLVRGVLTDIDDTLTTEGAITPDALDALERLRRAGLHVVAITGRPVGWSVSFAQAWPIDAIVVENGSVALVPAGGSLVRHYLQDARTRAHNFARMQQVAAHILEQVPGAKLSQDSPGRETDIAIDHSEFTHLHPQAIDEVVRIMRSEGMSATVSSIHINGWFGEHNKLVGARWIVHKMWGRDLDTESNHWAYVGDSTNDQVMFQAFGNSVGVANIRQFVSRLAHLPRYITQGERGAGFAEVADAVLSATAGAPNYAHQP